MSFELPHAEDQLPHSKEEELGAVPETEALSHFEVLRDRMKNMMTDVIAQAPSDLRTLWIDQLDRAATAAQHAADAETTGDQATLSRAMAAYESARNYMSELQPILPIPSGREQRIAAAQANPARVRSDRTSPSQ